MYYNNNKIYLNIKRVNYMYKNIQSQFSIKFPRYPLIRRKVNDIEDILISSYNQPQILPLPDEVNPELPRIIFNSKNGHSNIQISQISITLNIIYDDKFCFNVDRCFSYIQERINLINQIMNKLSILKFCYCGLTHITAEILDNPVSILSEKFNITTKSNIIYQIQQCTTEISQQKFFINKNIQSYEKEKNIDFREINELKHFSNLQIPKERGILRSWDINNRYEYLYNNIEQDISEFIPLYHSIFNLMKKYVVN